MAVSCSALIDTYNLTIDAQLGLINYKFVTVVKLSQTIKSHTDMMMMMVVAIPEAILLLAE